MSDTKELRRLAQAATPHVGHACKYQDAHWLREGHVDFENADLFIASERPQEDAAFYAAANPATVIELLDRLEEAESGAIEQARLNGMGSEREAALMAKLEAAEKECNALRAELSKQQSLTDAAQHIAEVAQSRANQLQARIEAMEKQEPIARFNWSKGKLEWLRTWDYSTMNMKSLYLAPGAKGEEKMGKVTESIFDGVTAVIPLAEVCYVSKFTNCIDIHFKSGRELNLIPPDQNAFLAAWCRYRAELEADTLMDFEKAQPAPSVPVSLITDYLVSISAHVAHQEAPQAQAEIRELLRMLAAAPEAKP